MELRKFLLILSFALVVVLAVVVWFYPSSGDLREENPFWNGVASFAKEFDVVPLSSLSNLPTDAQGTALVVVPYISFAEAELSGLRDYVSSGGTLVLLDDFGYGNEVVAYLGLEARFNGETLVDPLFNYKNRWFPKVTDFAGDAVAGGVESIVLNHATALEGVPPDSVICWSSRFSFIDSNDNAAWDEGEVKGPFPVAAATEVGGGCVVLVADPSILLNSMQKLEDDRAFVKAIIEIQGPTSQILVDQSHLPGTPLDNARGLLASVRAALAQPLSALAIMMVVVMLALWPVWRRKKGDSLG